jgi:predicted enzyme related to lactoylglutathione lyase
VTVTVRRIVPNFRSDEPSASSEFYEGVLGLELAMDMGWIATFVSPTNPSAQVGLIRQDATAPVHPDASIEVEDVDEAHARAVERGFEIVHPLTDEPWGVRRFFVRDPNGMVVNVLSHL